MQASLRIYESVREGYAAEVAGVVVDAEGGEAWIGVGRDGCEGGVGGDRVVGVVAVGDAVDVEDVFRDRQWRGGVARCAPVVGSSLALQSHAPHHACKRHKY